MSHKLLVIGINKKGVIRKLDHCHMTVSKIQNIGPSLYSLIFCRLSAYTSDS